MIHLKGTEQDALTQLSEVPHAVCQAGLQKHWHVGPDGQVAAQSALWLFCWAKTGMGSDKAAAAARQAFNRILNISYEAFDSRVPHEWARRMRYSSANLESTLNDLLAKETS